MEEGAEITPAAPSLHGLSVYSHCPDSQTSISPPSRFAMDLRPSHNAFALHRQDHSTTPFLEELPSNRFYFTTKAEFML